MKHVTSTLCFSIIFLSIGFCTVSRGDSDTPRKFDQSYLDMLDERMKQYLKDIDYESVIQTLPDDLLLDILDDTKDDTRLLSLIKTYCFIMLGRHNEAGELMEKLVLHHNDIATLFIIKGLVDCHNDNYGNATISFTKAIELSESVQMKFSCYMQRASIYAMRRMHKEAENDLALMQEMRQQFPRIIPPGKSPAEFIIGEYLADPHGKAIYRLEVRPTDPSKPGLYVYWWCANISEETINEFARRYAPADLPQEIIDQIPARVVRP